MLPAGILNLVATGLGLYEAYSSLRGVPSAVGHGGHQDHIRTVPSEPPENRLSES